MKCYSCGKEETIRRKGRDRVSDIDRVEVDIEESRISDDEERYMPLCQKCVRKYMTGRMKGIDKKWQEETKRLEFIAPPPEEDTMAPPPSGWVCPRCGMRETLPIAYGLPTLRTEEEARQGKILLGGCDPSTKSRHCRFCGHDWDV